MIWAKWRVSEGKGKRERGRGMGRKYRRVNIVIDAVTRDIIVGAAIAGVSLVVAFFEAGG
jgi:hypothetical protein